MARNNSERTNKLLIFCLFICFLLPLLAPSAHAESPASDFLRLAGKLTPGMSFAATEELLGPPAETHPVGGDAALLRKSWLHGELGIEIYFLKEAAYRIDLSHRFEGKLDLLRTLDELTRQGQRTYGSMPRFDTQKNEYYWESGGRRLSFSRYDSQTIRVRHSNAP